MYFVVQSLTWSMNKMRTDLSGLVLLSVRCLIYHSSSLGIHIFHIEFGD